MKKKIESFKSFSRQIGRGMHIEWQETREIPSLLASRQYRKAGEQIADICKMAGLGIIWVIPGGAVITAFLVKFSCKIRPSAFREEKEKQICKLQDGVQKTHDSPEQVRGS
jgi:hypothetical protein